MTKAIPQKDQAKIEQILTDIDASSLLQKDEAVIEGCFPIRIKNRKYYCLLTDSRLIIAARKGVFVPQKLQIIPLQNIEDISLDIYRHPVNFLLNAILIPVYIASFSLFLLLGVQMLFWICMICLILLAPYSVYYFVRGEDIVRLKVPGNTLSLRRTLKYYWVYGRGSLTFFEIDENSFQIHGKKGDIQDLYSFLVSYIKSS